MMMTRLLTTRLLYHFVLLVTCWEPRTTLASRDTDNVASSCSEADDDDLALAIRIVPADKLHISEPDPQGFGNPPNPSRDDEDDENWSHPSWLQSRFHFSFAEYYNAKKYTLWSLAGHERRFGTTASRFRDSWAPRHGNSNLHCARILDAPRFHGNARHVGTRVDAIHDGRDGCTTLGI